MPQKCGYLIIHFLLLFLLHSGQVTIIHHSGPLVGGLLVGLVGLGELQFGPQQPQRLLLVGQSGLSRVTLMEVFGSRGVVLVLLSACIAPAVEGLLSLF